MEAITQALSFNHPFFYIILIWSFIWKGIALWHAARHKQLGWFIAILLINTIGVFEIVYLLIFKRDRN